MALTNIFQKIDANKPLSRAEVVTLLSANEADTVVLYKKADDIRRTVMGDEVFIRGIIEFSNFCRKDCFYCGIHRTNTTIPRYRISDDEIIATCKKIAAAGATTVVLQSGEDMQYTKERFGSLLARIKNESGLTITVSVGERDEETYRHWQSCGMDRYLLRFETSNRDLFYRCHPDDDFDNRINCIKTLSRIGVQTGSGFLIGLPNETLTELADDILFCTDLNLDMIGIGPFIPHPDTALGSHKNPFAKEIYFKTVAILRLLNKNAHIPSTTAFDAIDPEGRNLLLQRGANVFMPNATPQQYRSNYQLYPGKPCVDESSDETLEAVKKRIARLGRTIGKGPGDSKCK